MEQRENKTLLKCVYTNSAYYLQTSRQMTTILLYVLLPMYGEIKIFNKLQPITTVAVDHVLPKIDLGIEHVLIGVGNRNLFRITHVTKVGSDFTPKISAIFLTPCVFDYTRPASEMTYIVSGAGLKLYSLSHIARSSHKAQIRIF